MSKGAKGFFTKFHKGVQLGLIEPNLGHAASGLMGQYPVKR